MRSGGRWQNAHFSAEAAVLPQTDDQNTHLLRLAAGPGAAAFVVALFLLLLVQETNGQSTPPSLPPLPPLLLPQLAAPPPLVQEKDDQSRPHHESLLPQSYSPSQLEYQKHTPHVCQQLALKLTSVLEAV